MGIRFEVRTPLGVKVRTTEAYWREITTHKHPVMAGKGELVRRALRAPMEVRRSRSDPQAHLYYQREPGTPYKICVLVKHLNGEGFIVTTYRTDRVKEGHRVWTS